MSGGHARNPFVQVLEEIGIAALIIVGHGFLAVLAILVGAGVHKALEYFTDPAHPFELHGVSARYIIEGGEVILIGVVLGMGVLSALVLLAIRLGTHVRG
jgi:hypothetical protein